MKKFLFLAAIMAFAIVARAQKITVVDGEGNGVPYAMVLAPNGEHLGITNLEGVLEDLKGAKSVTISHVAFKPKEVKLSGGGDTVVTLEDADFSLDEIVISPKPLVYVQTFYRVFFYDNKHGIVYYRAGLTDNAYDRKKNKVTASTKHMATGFKGIVTNIINMALGWGFDRRSELRPGKREERMVEKNKEIQLKITQTSPVSWRVSDFKGTVGTITDDKSTGWRHFAINSRLISLHKLEAKGKKKELKKRQEYVSKAGNEVRSESLIYHIDEDGNYTPEDFVMEEFHDTFDTDFDGDTLHCIIGYQVFSTDRAYVTKDELKQRQKANEMKMTYNNIRQFEKQNNIPELPSVIEQAIGKLVNK